MREAQQTGHILVVDDDAGVQTLLCAELARARYCVEGANTGPQGLAMAASHFYDALVVDQMLPGLGGLDVLRALADIGVHVPAIFITGYGADQFREAAIALGAVECLDKPFRPRLIVGAIERVTGRIRVWPAGAGLFGAPDGSPALVVARLARMLASSPTGVTRLDLLRRFARTAADPHVSLLEFVAVSAAFKRTMRSSPGPLGPGPAEASRPLTSHDGRSNEVLDGALLLRLATDLRSHAISVTPMLPLLTLYLDLLNREPSACHLSVSGCSARLGVRLTELEEVCTPLGLTPIRCRTAYQMRRIVRALVETSDEHVKQITYQLGYAHPSNLTRAFAGYFGVGPREFRRLFSR